LAAVLAGIVIFKRQIRAFYERFISLKGEPQALSAGLAMGVFVGVTPTIPFHTALIVILGLLFKLNMTAAYLGSWLISNPLTIPFFYFTQYELGRVLLGMTRCSFALTDYSLPALLDLGWQILLPLLVGGIVMAPFIAAAAYVISHRLLKALRARREA
jgi:uncharacterized protein (DUF2062 family)